MEKIGKYCAILSGYAFDSKLFNTEERGKPLIRIRDVKNGYTSTYTQEKYDDKYIIKKDDLLVGMDGEFNCGKWEGEEALLNQRVCKIKTDNKVLLQEYLFYILKIELKKIEQRTSYVTVKHLSVKQINNIEITIPTLEVQFRIVKILNQISSCIKYRKQQILDLDLLVKSQFVEMFGDPIKNPKNWEIGVIRDVVSEVRYGTSRPAVEGGKYKYLRMGNITYNGDLDLSELKNIDIPDSEIEKCMVQKGDVLFNRTNSKELVGKTCVFDSDEPMVIAGYIIRVRVNEKVVPLYLSAVLNSQYGKQTLYDMCKAIVGQANINAQELQNIKLCIPPIELQNQFATFVQQIDKSKLAVQKSLEELETLKQALMQQYFGRKEV